MIAATIFGAILLLGISAYFYFGYAPAPAVPALHSITCSENIKVGDRYRTYLTYIPRNIAKNPGIIIALHGSGMTAERMRQWTGFELDELADQHGFIVVYPDGYQGNWNDCRKDSPYAAKKENIDDVGFIQAIIDRFHREHQVDSRKVFLFGFSNGGQMAFRLAIESPDLISAVCVIGANLPTSGTCSCALDGPASRLMLIAGTADPINPYTGGLVSLFGIKKLGYVMSARETAENFARRNQVSKKPERQTLDDSDDNKVESLTYYRSGIPQVKFYTIENGGHVIPQPKFRFPRIMGKTAATFDSPLAAVSFFRLLGDS